MMYAPHVFRLPSRCDRVGSKCPHYEEWGRCEPMQFQAAFKIKRTNIKSPP